MNLFRCSIIWLALTAMASAQPVITPTNFLDTNEPPRMCAGYIASEFGADVMLMVQPSGGAPVKVDLQHSVRLLYIFCDQTFNRLVIFTVIEQAGMRTPAGPIRAYGLDLEPAHFRIPETFGSFRIPYRGQAEKEHFSQPVDIAVSSANRYYDPVTDFIYVIDQGNMRIVKLRYDVDLDSLVWVDSFGSDILNMPTAIDYADYADSDFDNDDVYVADGLRSKIFRFTRHGFLEMSYGGWNSAFGGIGYPTGISVSANDSLSDVIYITDSKKNRIMRLRSSTSGPIEPELWYELSLDSHRYVKAVDTDTSGRVYVIDDFTNDVTVFTPDLGKILTTYGGFGHEPGLFDHPHDIYIDNDEIQLCEKWAQKSGIQSLKIQFARPAQSVEALPGRFFLYQNYPNPFNSTTTMKFDLPGKAKIRLALYNMLGQEVVVLVDQTLEAGPHNVVWDGRNAAGNLISSGIYVYKIVSNELQSARKLLLLK